MTRQVSVLICQDIRQEYDGKLTLVGVFTSDLSIPTVPVVAAQLSFLFVIEGDVEDPLQSLSLEVAFPGVSEHPRIEIPSEAIGHSNYREGSEGWRIRIPMTVANIVLNPGRIECIVTHDKGVIHTGAAWITLAPIANPSVPET